MIRVGRPNPMSNPFVSASHFSKEEAQWELFCSSELQFGIFV